MTPRPGAAPPPARALADETGSILPLFGTAVATAALVLVLVVDATAYLVAASRAQAAADAAALAAIAVADPRARAVGDPRHEAARVASTVSARVETCACAVGARSVTVEVSVAVPAVVVGRLAARRVTAVASAELRPGPAPVQGPSGPPFAQTGSADRTSSSQRSSSSGPAPDPPP